MISRIPPKYLVVDIQWIKTLEDQHKWLAAKYSFKDLLEILLSSSNNNISNLLVFNLSEVVWHDIEQKLSDEDLALIDINEVSEVIDRVLCCIYMQIKSFIETDEEYIFCKWLDRISLILERDDIDKPNKDNNRICIIKETKPIVI